MSRTLLDYLEKLKPAQKDFIVNCVKDRGNKPDFHHGLLPFLTVNEAKRWLNQHLEEMMFNQDRLGEKYTRQLISAISHHADIKLYEDEVKTIMPLHSKRLKKIVGPYMMSGKFTIRLRRFVWISEDRMAHLQMVSKDMWAVTTHPDDVHLVTIFLSDHCYFS